MIARLARGVAAGALGVVCAAVLLHHASTRRAVGYGRGWRANGRNGWTR